MAVEDTFKNYLDCIQSPVLALSKELKIIYCNAYYGYKAGKPVDELEDCILLDAIPELTGGPAHKAYLDVLESGNYKSVETRLGNHDMAERIYPTPYGIISIGDDVCTVHRFDAVAQGLSDKYHDMFDEAWDALIVHDTYTTQILEANRSACEMFGYSREEIARLDMGRLCPDEAPYSGEEFMRWLRLSSDSRSQSMEWKVRDRSGRMFWIEVKSKRMTIGGQVRLVAAIRDINPVKLAGQKLRISRDTYEDFFNNASDFIFVHDLGGNLISANPAGERITGYSMAELVHMNIQELADNESLPLLRGFQYQRIGPGRHINYEMALVTKYDKQAFLDVSIWPLYKNGKIVAIQGIARSITRLKNEQSRLMQSESNWIGMVDCLPDATMAIDMEGKVVVWNQAMERLTGIKAEEMVGKGDFEYALAFYQTKRPIMVDLVLRPEEVKQYYSVIEVDNYTVISEFATPRLRGEGRYLWGRAMPWYDKDGKLLGAIECLRDVTDRYTTRQKYKEGLHYAQDQLARLRSALNKAGVLMLSYDLDGVITTCTDAMSQWLGYQPGKVMGKHLEDLLGAERQARLLTEQAQAVSMEFTCQDGSLIRGQVEIITINNEEGKFAGGVIIMNN